MTKLPTDLTVGPFVYTISTDEDALLRACRDERSDLLGFSDHRQLQILLRPDQAEGTMRDTLLHEVVHTLLTMTGMADEWGPAEEEKVVQRLTPALLDVIRSNPALVGYLTS